MKFQVQELSTITETTAITVKEPQLQKKNDVDVDRTKTPTRKQIVAEIKIGKQRRCQQKRTW